MQLQPEEILYTLLGEFYARRNFIFILFVLISLSFLGVGTIWPKHYTATAVIQVNSTSILKPLLQGAAEEIRAVDHVANAREIIFGEKIMNAVLQEAEWDDVYQTEIEQERIKQEIKKYTKIYGLGEGLIKIEYRYSEPERTFKTVKAMSEIFVSEGEKVKSEESEAAFNFIDNQVNEYLEKLTNVEQTLIKFHADNPDSGPEQEAEVSNRITTLKARIEQTQLEIRETRIKRDFVKTQLSGEAAITISHSREGQYRSKIAGMQADLESLRLDFKDTYPDIVRLKHQITDVKSALHAEIERRKNVISQSKKTGELYVDEAILLNPLYQQLRGDLSKVETRLATLTTRLEELKKILESEYERSNRIHSGSAMLSKLTRDYGVNKEIYQDLLKRRENARVSKSLDLVQRGVKFKIQEPAIIPLLPSGLRFFHFALVGLVFGLMAPLMIIYAVLFIDPRIHFSKIISTELNIPVLAEINQITSISEEEKIRTHLIYLAIGIGVVLCIYGYVGWLKFQGQF
jgi:polysaccharide chain length determinant protein (PEP-CTERM system associated)